MSFQILQNLISSFDIRINEFITNYQSILATKIFVGITMLGGFYVVAILLLLISIVLLFFNKRWSLVVLWLSVAGSEATTFLAKLFFQRTRPTHSLFFESSYSFPSGHATVAVALYGLLGYFLFKSVVKSSIKVLIIILTLVVVILIGFSRLYLGVHYFSDVIVGYLVGFCWLAVSISIFERKKLD